MKEMNVNIKRYIDDSYKIIIGYDLLETLVNDIADMFHSSVHKYAIITDSNVEKLYGRHLLNLMKKSGLNSEIFVITAGEKSKTRETKAWLEDEMLKAGFRKDSCVIALGGGVISDLAGFLAATYCRGIPIVNYATTFLAAADAAIGGKTAVDTPLATNMIGLIVQPKRVYIDLKTWETLGEEQINDGLSETIKHACMADYSFFEFLETHIDDIKSMKKEHLSILEYICEKNAQIKYAVVTQDEQETGLRQILNLGHTVGRAVEAACNLQISHGRAVSIGMAAQLLLAQQKGYLTETQRARVISLYNKVGLPTRIDNLCSVDSVIEKMYADKKVRKGEIKFVFQNGIGNIMTYNGQYSISVDETEIKDILTKIG